MKSAAIAIVVTLVGSPGLAASPERVGVFYENRCHNCHVIRDTGGTLLAGIDMPHVAKKALIFTAFWGGPQARPRISNTVI